MKEITPPVFLSIFLQRGLQSLLVKTTEQAIELKQLAFHPHFTSVQCYCPVQSFIKLYDSPKLATLAAYTVVFGGGGFGRFYLNLYFQN